MEVKKHVNLSEPQNHDEREEERRSKKGRKEKTVVSERNETQ